jgi:hypothetical protein
MLWGRYHISLHASHPFSSLTRPVAITRRRVLGVFAGAAAAVGVPSIWISNMKTYEGPVSDHFDGTRFFDPAGVPPSSLC